MRAALLAVALGSLVSTASLADSFKIEPGKYKTVMTMKMSMMPKPMTNTSENCVTPEEATKGPEDIVKEMAQGGQCTASNVSSTKSNMMFNFQCTGGDMGDVNGQYELSFADSFYTFKGKMSGTMQGVSMEMEMDGKAERIGDC